MKIHHILLTTVAAAASLSALGLWTLARGTDADIRQHRSALLHTAAAAPSVPPTAAQLAALPVPVQRWVAYTFPGGVPRLSHVALQMQGEFRRPRTSSFSPTSASQTLAAGTPALVFDATTPIGLGLWARAYDAFVDGRMDMQAKILSAVTVVNEPSSAELDRISLRRWLLEAPLMPVALLPGGAVRWEPVDAQRARAVVAWRGMSASLVASFGADGQLERFDSETDGDLGTPYHGSGEHVARSDYQRVGPMMIPMQFSIARAAGGQLHPFWRGRVTQVQHTAAGQQAAAVAPATLLAGMR